MPRAPVPGSPQEPEENKPGRDNMIDETTHGIHTFQQPTNNAATRERTLTNPKQFLNHNPSRKKTVSCTFIQASFSTPIHESEQRI